MAILVTGGEDIIGSVTVERLREANESVVVLDDLARGHRAALDAGVPFYQGRVGDHVLVDRISREHKVDSCIHFAALAYVGESVEKPAVYFENNVEQGIILVRALMGLEYAISFSRQLAQPMVNRRNCRYAKMPRSALRIHTVGQNSL